MEINVIGSLLIILVVATLGGGAARLAKLTPLVGYIVAGVLCGGFLGLKGLGFEKIAEMGAMLLLFSIGLEFSPARLGKIVRGIFIGVIGQIITVTFLGYLVLTALGVDRTASLILATGFSLSSTALVVKVLDDQGESETIFGHLMVVWLLIQDLATIPIMVVISALASPAGGLAQALVGSLLKAGLVVCGTLILGRLFAPFLLHQVASLNSRELLILAAVSLVIGTAAATLFLGISPVLGAFLAGVVISECQEKHAVFTETRPLRDLFAALFFVTMGFLVTPGTIISFLPLILALVILVILIKFSVVLVICFLSGYHGKIAVATAFGLAQVGEFAFIIFAQARSLNLLSDEFASVGITVALFSLVVTPLLFKSVVPFWRWFRDIASVTPWLKKFAIGRAYLPGELVEGIKNHIIICGYGRVGSWVGKALGSFGTPFVVIDYNQRVVNELKAKGTPVIYGDPAQLEVLQAAGVGAAKAVVVAIPDRVAQEELIAILKSRFPQIHIVGRAHFDEDLERLKLLRVDKVVQPEFEAAVSMVRSILTSMGESKEAVNQRITNLRLSRAKS